MEAKIKATLGDKLHSACENGDLHTSIEHITLQKAGKSFYTPPLSEMLYTATGKDRLNVVKYCIDNGAVITDNVIKKLLICRAKETYLFLLRSKALDVDYYIPWFGDILSNVATAGDMKWVELCLAHGADPNQNLVDEHKSILAAVAELVSIPIAALLVSHGAQVTGSGAIVVAAEEGKLQMVEYLLENGANIDEIGIEHPSDERYREDMGSALHRAVHGGHEEVVRFLLEKGANVNLKDVMGRTPLGLAQVRNYQELASLLKEHGAVSE